MKIGLKLSFEYKSVDGIFYQRVIENFLKFDKYGFRKDSKSYPWNDRFKKDILKASYETGIAVYSKDSDIFSAGIAGQAMKNEFQSVSIEQSESLLLPTNDSIEDLISQKNFVSAYLYNVDYVEVQSQNFHNNIKHRNISDEIWNSVRNTPFKMSVNGTREYDIRFNSGRCILLSYTWIIASWKMWLGENFFKLVPKEKILSFAYAFEIKEIRKDLIYINLFDNISESHTPENVFRQTKWLEWIDVDALIKKG